MTYTDDANVTIGYYDANVMKRTLTWKATAFRCITIAAEIEYIVRIVPSLGNLKGKTHLSVGIDSRI